MGTLRFEIYAMEPSKTARCDMVPTAMQLWGLSVGSSPSDASSVLVGGARGVRQVEEVPEVEAGAIHIVETMRRFEEAILWESDNRGSHWRLRVGGWGPAARELAYAAGQTLRVRTVPQHDGTWNHPALLYTQTASFVKVLIGAGGGGPDPVLTGLRAGSSGAPAANAPAEWCAA
ncbi:hypothetical protein PLESTM_002002500 [Pleodorina starrii]|nr:hypothetical protein PLESTM_002002500 [Pleodorina starrii]